eukprot:gene53919-25676_t
MAAAGAGAGRSLLPSPWAQAASWRGGAARRDQLARASPHYGADARQAWTRALQPKWAPSTQATYINALRLFRAVALGWSDMQLRAAQEASNQQDGCVVTCDEK